MELCTPYYNSGREIVTDNFFTSHSLAVALLQQNLTLLGTIRVNRVEVLPEQKDKRRPVFSTRFAHDHENKIVLASYIPKRNKVVILLSSSHAGNEVVPENANKPRMILDYNTGKKGVDQMDENVEQFTCRRKTVRWPLLIFFDMLDVACFNAYLTRRNDGSTATRKEFLKSLSKQLCQRSVAERFLRNPRLPFSSKEAAIRLGFTQREQRAQERAAATAVDRCRSCGKKPAAASVTDVTILCVQHTAMS